MTQEKQIALLTIVNAPYQTYMDGSALAAAICAGDFKKGQVSSFFTEAEADVQKEFAQFFGVPKNTLVETAAAFAKWSGQTIDPTA